MQHTQSKTTWLLNQFVTTQELLYQSIPTLTLRQLLSQAWFTFMDFDRGCIMPREEYKEAVHLLRQFSADPQQAKSYQSFDRWKADHRLHRRVEWDPQRALQEPITASQQVSCWQALSCSICHHRLAVLAGHLW